MRTRRPVIILLFLSLTVFFTMQVCSAEEQDSLFIAGTNLKIGMAKSYVVDQISKYYRILKFKDDEDHWFIFPDAGEQELVGRIMFEESKISFVEKNWGTYEKQAATELMKFLYRRFSEYIANGYKSAELSVGSVPVQPSPGEQKMMVVDQIIFRVGRKALIVGFYDKRITIYEDLKK